MKMETKEQRFSQLVKEHEKTIYAVCYMFSHDAEDVDDLHQEILLRLWQGYDGFAQSLLLECFHHGFRILRFHADEQST